MPTYEYQCGACGHEFELFQSMTAPVKRKCPKCSKAKLQRLIGTGSGIIFKGGGFYQTDYRSEGYKKSAEAEKKSADPVSKESTGTEKKEKKSDSPAASESEPKTKSPKSDSNAPSKRRKNTNN